MVLEYYEAETGRWHFNLTTGNEVKAYALYMGLCLSPGCCPEPRNQAHELWWLASGSLRSCPTRLWTNLQMKFQWRIRRGPAMKLDGLAFCSWILTDKFKIPPIFNPMTYYKSEDPFSDFLLSAKVTLWVVYDRNVAKIILITRTNRSQRKQCILLSETNL